MNEVKIDIPQITQEAGLFAMTSIILSQIDQQSETPHDPLAPLVLAARMLLPPEMPSNVTVSLFFSMIDAVKKRVIHSRAKEDIVFPPWDPDQTDLLDLYPIADAFIAMEAWVLAFSSDNPPEDYFGPLFSVAGHVLFGVESGRKMLEVQPEIIDDYKKVMLHGKSDDPEEIRQLLNALSSGQKMIDEYLAVKKD